MQQPVNFEALFASVPALYLVLTPELTIVAVSDAYLRATMTRREEIIGKNLFDVFPDNPDDPAATGARNLRESLERVVERREADAMAVQKYDVRKPPEEGGAFEERFWSPFNSPVLDESGRLLYIIHCVEDVTEFLRLREQETLQQNRVDEYKSRAANMEAEILRRAQQLQEVNRELRQLKAGLEVRVEARTAELRDANQALARSEEQLRRSQKLEAVGRLAGGIAHDFNNLLTAVISYSEILLNEVPELSGREELQEIHRAGQRAATLTRQLLAFSRQQVLEPRVLDLNEIIKGCSNLLRRILGEDIELRTIAGPLLGHVRADPGQLEQVIMNLAINARDAMPNGGKLSIQTANVELDEVHAREYLGIRPGLYVMLAVTDTGVGMDRATQSRIFEPFFTTKDQGKGTGLGLSTVFGIVKQSGGGIWVYSEPGAGATFKLYFPRTDAALDSIPPLDSQPNAHRGSETILLVEDDEQVRNVATSILRRCGYHVLEARTPAEALLISEQHPVRIHLLLTDVVMPKMSGRELAERLHRSRADMNVLFMSGYTDDAVLHHGVLDSDVAFVQKPLTPDSLCRKVRQVLDGVRGSPAGNLRSAR
ncbi:MAG: ATP-binding protein [Myxococcota bacterium]